MPRVLFTPYPETGAQPTPPNDYQNIPTSPEMFGGMIGAAAQRTGAQLSQVGTELTNTYSELSAQQENSNFTSKVNTILFGDPNNPADTGYYGMHGQAAMDARASTLKAIEDARAASVGRLSTTQSQVMFNNEARYYVNRVQGEIGRHYDNESKVWAGTVQKTRYDGAVSDAALRYNDDSALTDNAGQATSALVQKAQTEGLLPPTGQPLSPEQSALVSGYRRQAVIGTYESAIRSALGRGDAARARQLFDANKDALSSSKDFDTLQRQLKSAGTAILGDQWLNEANGHAAAAPRSSAGGSNAEIASNNFAGMRAPGVAAGGGPASNPSGWQHFDTPEAGVAAISHQLDRYASGATTGTPLTTIRQIVSTWAPPSENQTSALITRAARVTGFAPDQQLNMADPDTKAKVIEAMIRGEQGGNLPVDPAIIQKVAGQSGGAPVVTPISAPPAQAAVPAPSPPPGMADLAANEMAEMQRHAQVLDRLSVHQSEDPEAWAHAVQKESIDNSKRLGLIAAQRRVVLENRNVAVTEWMRKFQPGQPIDPDAAAQIHADPRLDGESIKGLDAVMASREKSTAEGEAKAYGPKYFGTPTEPGVVQGIADGTIHDPTQLLKMTIPKADGSQDLTTAGYDRAVRELAARKTVDGAAEGDIRKGAMAYARHHISFEADLGFGAKIRDPDGEDRFNVGFLPAFYKYWDDGIKSGKTPQELSDKKAIDAVMQPFMRSPADLQRARIAAGVEDIGGPGASAPTTGHTDPETGSWVADAPVNLSTKEGIVAAYQSGRISRNAAAEALATGGFWTPPATPATPAPQAPLR